MRGCHWSTLASVASPFSWSETSTFEYDNAACMCVCVCPCLLSRGRLILQRFIKVCHQYWFVKEKNKTKHARCIPTVWWCPLECQPGLPPNRINAWIWSERTNTRWSLIKKPFGKDFNEILLKVHKQRCQAESENGLCGLFSAVMNKITAGFLGGINSLVVISGVWNAAVCFVLDFCHHIHSQPHINLILFTLGIDSYFRQFQREVSL